MVKWTAPDNSFYIMLEAEPDFKTRRILLRMWEYNLSRPAREAMLALEKEFCKHVEEEYIKSTGSNSTQDAIS